MAGFTPSGSGGLSQSISVGGASELHIDNYSIVTASTEYTVTLPIGTRMFGIRILNDDGKAAMLRIYSTSGGTAYLSVNPGAAYVRSDVQLTSALSIYVQSNLGGRTLQVEYWL